MSLHAVICNRPSSSHSAFRNFFFKDWYKKGVYAHAWKCVCVCGPGTTHVVGTCYITWTSLWGQNNKSSLCKIIISVLAWYHLAYGAPLCKLPFSPCMNIFTAEQSWAEPTILTEQREININVNVFLYCLGWNSCSNRNSSLIFMQKNIHETHEVRQTARHSIICVL